MFNILGSLHFQGPGDMQFVHLIINSRLHYIEFVLVELVVNTP